MESISTHAKTKATLDTLRIANEEKGWIFSALWMGCSTWLHLMSCSFTKMVKYHLLFAFKELSERCVNISPADSEGWYISKPTSIANSREFECNTKVNSLCSKYRLVSTLFMIESESQDCWEFWCMHAQCVSGFLSDYKKEPGDKSSTYMTTNKSKYGLITFCCR